MDRCRCVHPCPMMPRRRCAAWARRADQRETRAGAAVCWRVAGAARARARARRRRNVAASLLNLPPISMASTMRRHLCALTSSGLLRSLDRRAWARAAPVKTPCRRRGWLLEVRGETNVVSTASWPPWKRGNLLAMTSMRRLSTRLTEGMFRCESRVCSFQRTSSFTKCSRPRTCCTVVA